MKNIQTNSKALSFCSAFHPEYLGVLMPPNIKGWRQVLCDANNRPIRFSQGNSTIECLYDYKGRRIAKTTYKDDSLVSSQCFVYDRYLQIAELDGTHATASQPPVLRKSYLWDPLEPVASRVLAQTLYNENGDYIEELYFCHDAQKNTTALFGILGGRRALYEYGAYGLPLKSEGNAAESNPFRYSSEYHDTELGLIYYNYRHYNPSDGRWLTRDPLGEEETRNLYRFVNNNPAFWGDALGLKKTESVPQTTVKQGAQNETKAACKEICSSMLGTLVFDYINYDSNAIILREYLSDPYQKVELEKTLKTKPSNFGLTFTLGGSANTDSTNILAKDVAFRFTGAATYNLVSDQVTFNTDYLNLSSAIKRIKKTYSINAQIQSTILTGSDSWLTLEGKLNYQYEQKPEIVVSVCWTTLW